LQSVTDQIAPETIAPGALWQKEAKEQS